MTIFVETGPARVGRLPLPINPFCAMFFEAAGRVTVLAKDCKEFSNLNCVIHPQKCSRAFKTEILA